MQHVKGTVHTCIRRNHFNCIDMHFLWCSIARTNSQVVQSSKHTWRTKVLFFSPVIYNNPKFKCHIYYYIFTYCKHSEDTNVNVAGKAVEMFLSRAMIEVYDYILGSCNELQVQQSDLQFIFREVIATVRETVLSVTKTVIICQRKIE